MSNYTPDWTTATPTIPVVDDGDDVDAAMTDPAPMRLADLIVKARPFLASFCYDSSPAPTYSNVEDEGTFTIPFEVSASTYTFSSSAYPTTTLFCDFSDCVAGDIVLVNFSTYFSYSIAGCTQPFWLKLFAVEDVAGTPTRYQIPGTRCKLDPVKYQIGADPAIGPVILQGFYTVTAPGDLRIEFGLKVDPADVGTGSAAIDKACSMICQLFRKID